MNPEWEPQELESQLKARFEQLENITTLYNAECRDKQAVMVLLHESRDQRDAFENQLIAAQAREKALREALNGLLDSPTALSSTNESVLADDYARRVKARAALRLPCPTFSGKAELEHGVTCPKVIHDPHVIGYLHDATEDGPYDDEDVQYCGRCHTFLP